MKVKTKCGARQHVNKKYKELKLCSIFLRHPRCPVGLRGFRGQKALEATEAMDTMETMETMETVEAKEATEAMEVPEALGVF